MSIESLTFSAGMTHEPDPHQDYCTSGIDVTDRNVTHYNRIELYGETVEEAKALRDYVLASLEVNKRMACFKSLTETQCSDGNWNYDPYMHGMANGMILATAVYEGKEPQYKDAPEQWLKDRPTDQCVTEPPVDVTYYGYQGEISAHDKVAHHRAERKRLREKCEHGQFMTDYCETCGRIHGG